MHKCWYCDRLLYPVYQSLATVFVRGLGYLVQGGGPISWVCTYKACRNYMLESR